MARIFTDDIEQIERWSQKLLKNNLVSIQYANWAN
jgi:hypothetical protein